MIQDKITHRGEGSNESEYKIYFVYVTTLNDENGNEKKNYGVYVDALIPEGFFLFGYKTREEEKEVL